MFPKITDMCLLLELSSGLKMRPTIILAKKRCFTVLFCFSTWLYKTNLSKFKPKLPLIAYLNVFGRLFFASIRSWTLKSCVYCWRFRRWSRRWSLQVPLVNQQIFTPSLPLRPAPASGKPVTMKHSTSELGGIKNNKWLNKTFIKNIIPWNILN